MYLEEKYYFGAIKEFQIAIALLPNSQASAAYYTNLGKTYEKIYLNTLGLESGVTYTYKILTEVLPANAFDKSFGEVGESKYNSNVSSKS